MCAEGVGEVSLRDLLASNEPNLEWAKSPMFLFRVRATTSLLLLLLVLPLLLMLPLLPPPSPHLHLQLVQAAERNDSARARGVERCAVRADPLGGAAATV